MTIQYYSSDKFRLSRKCSAWKDFLWHRYRGLEITPLIYNKVFSARKVKKSKSLGIMLLADIVRILRTTPQGGHQSRYWDSERSSLGLKIETHKISVSDSVLKLRLREYQSRSQSRKSKLSLADHWYPLLRSVQAGLAWLYSQLFQPPTQSQPNGESYISAVAN